MKHEFQLQLFTDEVGGRSATAIAATSSGSDGVPTEDVSLKRGAVILRFSRVSAESPSEHYTSNADLLSRVLNRSRLF